MVLMVFGNVVLRYAFNSGITVSEELSAGPSCDVTSWARSSASKEGRPPGHDMLIERLGPPARRSALAWPELMPLLLLAHLLGKPGPTRINLGRRGPGVGWSMAWLSGIGVVSRCPPRCCHGLKLGRLLSGTQGRRTRHGPESEDLAALDKEEQK